MSWPTMRGRLAPIAAGMRRRGPAPPPRSVAALHLDIARFAEQLCETEDELAQRTEAVARASMVVQTVWPGARVHLFGSAVSGMRLPYGDVDIMIEAPGANGQLLLPKLARALRDAAVPSTILTILDRRVPIIKWTDKTTGMKIDGCVNNAGGLHTSTLLRHSVASLDKLRPLTLVLKSQLLMHGLHNAFTGGVGGYLLANMVRHLLLLSPPPLEHSRATRPARESGAFEAPLVDEVPQVGNAAAARADGAHEVDAAGEDLGGALLRFYWYYGYQLDLKSSIVMSEGPETWLATGPGWQGWLEHSPGMLSINDPLKPESDLGAKAFRYNIVRQLLRASYVKLSAQVAEHTQQQQELQQELQHESSGDFSGNAGRGSSLLSLVLPKWNAMGSQHARRHQKELAQMNRRRRIEEKRMTTASRAIVSGSRVDPLWY